MKARDNLTSIVTAGLKTRLHRAHLDENPVKNSAEGFFPLIIFISIIGVYLTGYMARSKSIWLGAIFGGIAGVALEGVLAALEVAAP